MKREDIIRMAEKSGFYFHDAGYAPILHTVSGEYSEKCFERFADLVAEAEREACAELCEEEGDGHRDGFGGHCAAMIRARSTP